MVADPKTYLEAGKLIVGAYQLAEKQGLIDRIKAFFKKRQVVLMLGTTGAGKTNLLDALTKELPEAIHHLNRTPFLKERKLKISDEPFDFYDTQVLRKGSALRAA